MRWIVRLVFALTALLLGAFAWLGIPATAAGLVAKNLCSGVFVARRAQADVLAADVLPASPLLWLVHVSVDEGRQLVRGRMLWSAERTAMRLPGLGCVLDPTPALLNGTADDPAARQAGAAPTDGPPQDAGLPATDWEGIDRAAIAAAIDEAFRDGRRAAGRNTRAVVILHRGRLVAERYAAGFDAGTPQLGWSMSKTVLGLLVYMKLQAQQQDASLRAVDWVTPQRRPPWLRDWERDQRSSIRLADLLFMRDGLDHQESYEPWGTVPRMLWGVDDVPAFAGSAPPDAPAGQRFRYLSATTNILSRLLRAQFDSDAAYWRYPSQALFEPIGVRSAVLESDASGTFVASSYLWATPRDWARIGQVLLEDGLAGGRRVFAQGWQRFAGTPPTTDDPAAMGYGAHVWLPGAAGGSSCAPEHRLPADTFLSTGHWGQLVAVIPSRNAVVVRLGMTLDHDAFDRCEFLRAVIETLPVAGTALSGK